jgi:hypothetical protein
MTRLEERNFATRLILNNLIRKGHNTLNDSERIQRQYGFTDEQMRQIHKHAMDLCDTEKVR